MKKESLLQRDEAVVWHPFTQVKTSPKPLPIVKAKDVWLYTEDGEKYLDANSSWWTVLHGHGNKYIGDKIREQYDEIDHVIFAGVTHPIAVEASERIVAALPNNFQKVFFSDNGSTSVEVAIKMCFQYWYNLGDTKTRFLAIEGAYHGDTFGAMSVSERDKFNAPFEHLFFEVDYLPFPSDENWEKCLVQAEKHFASGKIAGFIFEPLVQGAAGMRIYRKEYLDALLKLAKKYGVLCIADEVMTGFYRTGTMFAIDQIKEDVDIVCLSKGVTGGVLPIGLTVTTQAIFDSFLDDETARGFLHGHSFTGNPMACAAICASMDLLETSECKTKIARIGSWHNEFVHKVKHLPTITNIASIGTILSIEVKANQTGYFSSVRDHAFDFFWGKGIMLRPLGNVIFINAPYCITKDEMDLMYNAIEEFLA